MRIVFVCVCGSWACVVFFLVCFCCFGGREGEGERFVVDLLRVKKAS